MAKIPTAADLGPTPQVQGARAIAGYDVRPLEQAGNQFGTGLEKAGQGIGDYATALGHFQFVQQTAKFATAETTLREQFANDPQGYVAALTKTRDAMANALELPAFRNRFIETSNDTLAKGAAWGQDVARAKANAATIEQAQQTSNAMGAAFASAPDDGTRQKLIGLHGALTRSLTDLGVISPKDEVEWNTRWGQQATLAEATTRIQNGDAAGVLNELQTAPSSPEQIDNRIIQVESNGNPLARSRSSHALGLGQFEPGTWLPLMRAAHPEFAGLSDDQLLALRADPTLARQGVALNRQQNTAYLQRNGVAANPGNIYLAHFLGPAGAAAIAKASPNMPAALVLSQAVGADKAAAMVRANPSILQGRTAGSVAAWAAGKMGGVGPGGGHLFDLLPPDQRAELATRAEAALNKQATEERASFELRVQNATAEALANGAPSQPIAPEEFIATYGADRGAVEYQEYETEVQRGHAIAGMATMTPEQRQKTIAALKPVAGDPDFALRQKAYETAHSANTSLEEQAKTDPAGFAAAKLPASQAAYETLRGKLADPTTTPAERAAAAQGYAAATLMEQEHFGIVEPNVVPKSYVDHFNQTISSAAASDDPKARTALIGQIQGEARMWGGYWPQVMRQIAPATQPVVRAIAAGADPTAMTRLLSIDPKEKPSETLKEQNGVKAADVAGKVNDAFAPFRGTMVGRQLDRDYPGYLNLGNELAALYVRDGMSADDAANKAFNDLVGARYDFRDGYRIPKSSGVAADDVAAGAQAARGMLGSFSAAPALDDMGLGAGNEADSLQKFGRDGKWITAPDNSGLNLTYDGKFVKTKAGAPLELKWDALAALGAARPDSGTRDVEAAPVLP